MAAAIANGTRYGSIAALALTLLAGGARGDLTASRLLDESGHDDAQLASLLAGATLSGGVAEMEASKSQLAAASLAWTAVPYERAVALIEQGDPRVGAKTWAISGAQTFSALQLPADDLQTLRSKGHRAFNLSAEESQTLREAAGGDEVLSLYRAMLAQRATAYQRAGRAAIAPYQRGRRGEVDPAEELARATASVRGSGATFDALRALLDSAENGVPDGDQDHRLQLVENTVQDRVHHALRHMMLLKADEGMVIVERQFYSSHSYDALQIIVGLLPHENGTLVAVFGQTSTDRVAGVGSNLAHSIGRGRSAESYADYATLVRDAIDALP
ncbi:MAG: hypothetical protein AAGA68_13955 [Pseudomonadota bacterium]